MMIYQGEETKALGMSSVSGVGVTRALLLYLGRIQRLLPAGWEIGGNRVTLLLLKQTPNQKRSLWSLRRNSSNHLFIIK